MSERSQNTNDAATALRFMLLKVGIFIGLPLVAALIAVLVMLA